MIASVDRNRRILVVDDNRAIHQDFRKILMAQRNTSELDDMEAALFGKAPRNPTSDIEFQIDSAFQGEEAVDRVNTLKKQGKKYAAAFVDMRMPPGWDGVKTIEELWKADPTLNVVICTAFSDYSWSQITERLGVTDRLLILKKPFDRLEVHQLALCISEKAFQTEQASFKLDQLRQMVDEQTQALRIEVEERRAMEEELLHARESLRHQATHCVTTQIWNRRAILSILNETLQSTIAARREMSLLFVDIDHFKTINDTHGHLAGDMVLEEVARRLAAQLRKYDDIGRYGGEEFLAVLPACGDDVAPSVAERLRAAVASAPVMLENIAVPVTISIGMATNKPPDYWDVQELIGQADQALYLAKSDGRNCARHAHRSGLRR